MLIVLIVLTLAIPIAQLVNAVFSILYDAILLLQAASRASNGGEGRGAGGALAGAAQAASAANALRKNKKTVKDALSEAQKGDIDALFARGKALAATPQGQQAVAALRQRASAAGLDPAVAEEALRAAQQGGGRSALFERARQEAQRRGLDVSQAEELLRDVQRRDATSLIERARREAERRGLDVAQAERLFQDVQEGDLSNIDPLLRAGAGYVVTRRGGGRSRAAAAAAAAASAAATPERRQAAYDYARDRYAEYRGGTSAPASSGVFADLASRMRGWLGRRQEYDEVSLSPASDGEDSTAATSRASLPV